MSGPDKKYLVIVECPVVFPGENDYALSSVDMLPRPGVTAGLVSRHMRVLDSRITAVCIWTNVRAGEHFFDEGWHTKADALWGEDYRTRSEELDGPPAV